MLSALLVVWIAVIPLAILGAAWVNARRDGRPGRSTADLQAARWDRIGRIIGRSRTFDLPDFVSETEERRPAAAVVHLHRRPTATLLAPRLDQRRACAAQRLRGRGDAGRRERS